MCERERSKSEFRVRIRLVPLHGEAPMPASATAAVYSEPRSQFLDGLAPFERQAILGAATPRRIRANSVITNQGHPADHLFMLTRGLTRHFVITEQGKFQWLGPGDLFGGRTALSIHSPYLFSTEAVTDASELVWERSTIRALIARYPRLLENALLTASDPLGLVSRVWLRCHAAQTGDTCGASAVDMCHHGGSRDSQSWPLSAAD
jgi:hypothetical protein